LKSWVLAPITVTISCSRTLRCLDIDIIMYIEMLDLLCSSKKCANYIGDQSFWTFSSPNASYSSYRSYSVNISEWHLIILTKISGRWSFIPRNINNVKISLAATCSNSILKCNLAEEFSDSSNIVIRAVFAATILAFILYPSAKENSKNKWYAFYKFIYLKKLWSHKYPYTRPDLPINKPKQI
jgi:hypothetical protein